MKYKDFLPTNIVEFDYLSVISKDILGYLIKEKNFEFKEINKKEIRKALKPFSGSIVKYLRELEEMGLIVATNGTENRQKITIKVERMAI